MATETNCGAMRVVVLATVLLLASGCTGRTGPPPDQDKLPPDWNTGVPLLAFQRSATHSGAAGANLYPDGQLRQPATCVAYRDEGRDTRDRCEVRESKYSWEEEYPWLAVADWAGCPGGNFNGCPGPPEPRYEGRVVAYDADGYPVAWWDGAEGPDMRYVTE